MFSFQLNKLLIQNNRSILNIEGVNFTISDSKNSFAILGDSGIGKTTIFKSLFSRYVQYWAMEKKFAFDCQHQLNKHLFNGGDIIKNRQIPNIGFSTQSPYFLYSESVKDNIFMPLSWKNNRWDDDRKAEYIKLFELDELTDNNISILSGGQKQVINIARMLVLHPDIAIIDECFSSMNEKMAYKYIDILKKEFKDIIFLITSHRKNDIDYWGAQYISLKKEQYKSGEYYVTQN
jgi:energy-coupling factor transport system ATP-binding protein